MRKSQRWPKIRSPPFIHWLNSNHGRIVILPPEDHELVVSHGGMFSLGSSIICWAGSLTRDVQTRGTELSNDLNDLGICLKGVLYDQGVYSD